MAIIIKNSKQIECLREAGRIVAETHELLAEKVAAGMTTYELDQIAEEYIRSQKAIPSFKGYNGFPGSICTSINEQVVHGIPSKEVVIKDGDIVSIDIGAYIHGYHGDAARSHLIGNASQQAKDLVRVTRESFFEGVKLIKPGIHLYEISAAIQKHIEKHGYSVVRDLVGHGVGQDLHEDPQIPNYKPIGRGPRLQAGMVVAIEPMVNIGTYEVRTLEDDWTIVTLDHSLSAHYENTLAITDDGYELLTLLS